MHRPQCYHEDARRFPPEKDNLHHFNDTTFPTHCLSHPYFDNIEFSNALTFPLFCFPCVFPWSSLDSILHSYHSSLAHIFNYANSSLILTASNSTFNLSSVLSQDIASKNDTVQQSWQLSLYICDYNSPLQSQHSTGVLLQLPPPSQAGLISYFIGGKKRRMGEQPNLATM